VTLAVNVIGGSAFSDCVRSLRKQGRLAVVGYLDGALTSEIDLEAVHGTRLRIFGFSNQLLSSAQRAEAVRGFIRNLLPAFAEGRITPLVDRVFPFDELPSAKDYVETNAHVGKVVVRLP